LSGNLPLFESENSKPPLAGRTSAAEIARRLLAESPAPLSPAQIRRLWPARPAPKPAVVEAALEELAARGEAARLQAKSGKTLWSARRLEDWLRQARERMLEAVRQAPAPLKEKELLAAAAWPKELDGRPAIELIRQLQTDGALKAWPCKTPAYWRLSPEETAPEALLESLGNRAMSRADWMRQAKARLKGVSRDRWERAAADLVAQGRVFQYTLRIDGKKVEACARAEHRRAFLELYRPMLERLKDEWRRLGASEEQIESFLSGKEAGSADTLTAEELLLEELKRLERESPPPNPVTFLRARPALRGLTKQEFDRAAMELFRRGRIYMAPHDHPWRLPEAEREALVHDGERNFYVSVTARS